jgi:hypothetical protein
MDSGPNHLNDISLDPKYAGICGFALEEFDSLFGDRLEGTLAHLQENGEMPPSANVADLKKKILFWYDGYNWGGKTRVLNPYSVLNFFEADKFNDYWSKLGRPGHVTALMRERPLEFLQPKLESYLTKTLKKSEMNHLEVAPVLFHSGFLTVDKIAKVEEEDPARKETTIVDYYSFKLPNHEIYSSSYKDCFKDIFALKDDDELKTKGNELKQYILARNEEEVGQIFRDYFYPIPYFIRPDSEKSFHALVHVIFRALGFNVLSELAGAVSRLDLSVQLTEGTSVVIELKYCRVKGKMKKADIDEALSAIAKSKFSRTVRNACLAEAIKNKLPLEEVDRILNDSGKADLSQAEENNLLVAASRAFMTEKEIKRALAEAARQRFKQETLKEILTMKRFSKEAIDEILSKRVPSEKEIAKALSAAADQALKDIKSRDYRSLVKPFADEIIEMGLVIHEDGEQVKAVFEPKEDGRPSRKLIKVCRPRSRSKKP